MKFNINAVNPNLLTLLVVQQAIRLKAQSDGRIVKAKTPFYSKRRFQKAVEMTFIAFLTPWYHSIDLIHLQKICEKKLQIAERIWDKLHKSKRVPSEFFKKMQQLKNMYKRFSMYQTRLMAKIEQAAERDKRHPLVLLAQAAIKRNNPLKPTQGCSGTYFLCDEIDPNEELFYRHLHKKEIIGIFKPFDEEIGGPNNPHSQRLQGAIGLNAGPLGIKVGENVHREVATGLLDQLLGFHLVPNTCYALFSHRYFYSRDEWIYRDRVKNKRGSFQAFMRGYKTTLPPFYPELNEVDAHTMHKLFILDTLIGNTDRHCGNLLIKKGDVAAIDNGRSFGDRHTPPRIFYKNFFPQMRMPFSKELIDQIASLNIDRVISKIKRRCFLDEKPLQRIKERYHLLVEVLKQNRLPYEIAQLFNSHFVIHRIDKQDKLIETAPLAIPLVLELLMKDVQMHHSLNCRRYKKQVCYLSNNEKIVPEFYLKLVRASLTGYLYGVGTGNIFSCLEAFKVGGPKGLIIIDWDPGQILVASTLKEGFKRAENWDEFVKELGCKKGWNHNIRKVKKYLDKDLVKALKGGIYPQFSHLRDMNEKSILLVQKNRFNNWALLKKHFNTLRQLALENRWQIIWGNCLNPQYRVFLQEQEGFSSTRSLFYLSNVLDHERQSLLETYGTDSQSPKRFCDFANRSLLYPWKNLPLAWVDATREKGSFLRFSDQMPHYELTDFYKLF